MGVTSPRDASIVNNKGILLLSFLKALARQHDILPTPTTLRYVRGLAASALMRDILRVKGKYALFFRLSDVI